MFFLFYILVLRAHINISHLHVKCHAIKRSMRRFIRKAIAQEMLTPHFVLERLTQ